MKHAVRQFVFVAAVIVFVSSAVAADLQGNRFFADEEIGTVEPLQSPPLVTGMAASSEVPPDADYIAYSSRESGIWEIKWYNPTSDQSGVLLSLGGSRIWGGAFSPDRSKFAFSSDFQGSFDIYWINSDGSGSIHQITFTAGTEFKPQWVNDSSLIFVTGTGYPNYEIEGIRIDGSNRNCLTCALPGSYTMPVLSPDGSRIAYTDNKTVIAADFPGFDNPCAVSTVESGVKMATDWAVNGRLAFYSTNPYYIFLSDDCGQNKVRLSPADVTDVAPFFSGDAMWIAFSNFVGNVSNVGLMDAFGNNETRRQLTFVSTPNAIEILDWGGTYQGTDPAQSVAVDINPASCPNPLNLTPFLGTDPGGHTFAAGNGPRVERQENRRPKKAVLPVALLGSEEFDVADIDPSTLQLEGVGLVRWNLEDVSTPADKTSDPCACNSDGPDGFTDLTLKFYRHEIAAALGEVDDGDVIELTLTGELYEGTPIEGTDCVVIIKNGKGSADDGVVAETDAANESDPSITNHPNPFNPTTEISFTLPTAGHVTVDIYNTLGQRVERLVDGHREAGEHTVTWDAGNYASGVYLYRLISGNFVETKQMVLLK